MNAFRGCLTTEIQSSPGRTCLVLAHATKTLYIIFGIASTLAGYCSTPLSVSSCPMNVTEGDLNWNVFPDSWRSCLLHFPNRLVRFLSRSRSASCLELPHPRTQISSAMFFFCANHPRIQVAVVDTLQNVYYKEFSGLNLVPFFTEEGYLVSIVSHPHVCISLLVLRISALGKSFLR